MSPAITATIELLQDYVARVMRAIGALQELEEIGIMPAGNIPERNIPEREAAVAATKPKKSAPKRVKPADPDRPLTNPPRATCKTVRSKDGKSKICHGCGVMKAIDLYPVNKVCKDGHVGTCTECNRKRVNDWYRAKKGTQTTDVSAKAEAPADPDRPFHCPCGKSFRTKFVFGAHQEKCLFLAGK
jgi:hypothetical protein